MSAKERHRGLAVVVGLALAAGGGALVGANYIKSPAQVAAEAAAPPSGPVTVAVEKRIVRATMVVRGDVTPESSFVVAAPAPREVAKPVLTRLAGDVGHVVAAGQVVAEVSGRPVIVLPGPTPAYRDLAPGAKGDDVAQLQEALRDLGHRVTDARGIYGISTGAAVVALYRSTGYEAQPTGPDDDRQIKAATRQVRDLQRAHDEVPPEGKAAAARTLADAKEDLADLVARTGPVVPIGEIAFSPVLPARIVARPVPLGGAVTGELVTLAGGRLVVRARVDERNAQLVRAGMAVEGVSEMHGKQFVGTVAEIAPGTPPGGVPQPAAQPGGGGVRPPTDPRPQITVHPAQPLDVSMVGQNVRLTVIAAGTDHDVLVVPLAAVSAREGGQAVVVRLTGGREERLVVTPGVSGGGFVEVTPTDTTLSPGDRVVVGW
ncbi:hypothetical protein [Actinokineospora globicatena]|uniref:Peptidoglycan binding domain-containing protein n=1 Tax=Actinokineospora globicatena TaxID=103729 RepID=A0A9W6QNG8_9PSEU|nr:hypothetical protein [Actinokineospora globicatena]GLW91633.1 hypothetical protein Aglo03_24490 [Actinokineospora globicatena]